MDCEFWTESWAYVWEHDGSVVNTVAPQRDDPVPCHSFGQGLSVWMHLPVLALTSSYLLKTFVQLPRLLLRW